MDLLGVGDLRTAIEVVELVKLELPVNSLPTVEVRGKRVDSDTVWEELVNGMARVANKVSA